MRASRIIFVCACVIALSLAGVISAAAADRKAPSSSQPAPTTPTTGKVDVTFNITIADSWIPSGDTIACVVTLNVEGDETTTFREEAAVAGTRNGNTATCVVPQYYSWLLQHPTSDTINLTYEVAVPPESVGSGLTLPFRENDQSGSIPVPSNGTVTRIDVDVTL